MNRSTKLFLGVLLLAMAGGVTAADGDIRIVPVSDSIYMLEGEGGNIGVFTGPDGTLMIDAKYAAQSEKILAAVQQVSGDIPEIVINTHGHQDHTGGNENFGKAGSLIVAHENVRNRMGADQFMEAFNRAIPAAPAAALPSVTVLQEIRIHWNDEILRLMHIPNAHTDGDIFVQFVKANVIHTGDFFFNGFYPFIDAGSGGSINGMVAAVDSLLEIVDDETIIIPGHGPLARRQELQQYRDMLTLVAGRIAKLLDKGMSREEIVAEKPTADLDVRWGDGFLAPDIWVGIVCDGFQRNAE